MVGRSELVLCRLLLFDILPTMDTTYSQVKLEFRQRAHPVFSPLQRIYSGLSGGEMAKLFSLTLAEWHSVQACRIRGGFAIHSVLLLR